MSLRKHSSAIGFTLVELIIAISIISLAVAGVMLAVTTAVRSSSEPVVQDQALAIAKSLLEEIESMPFTYCDPNDPAVYTATSAAGCTTPEVLGPELGETRYSPTNPFNNVNDYNGFNTATDSLPGIRDVTGTLISGLSAYNASVTITPTALGSVPATASLLISVTVTGPGNVSVTVEGYRTMYAPNSV